MHKTVADILLTDQRKTQLPLTTVDLKGKTVIVTGANAGLGLEACIHFARMNPARLIMTARDATRGKVAKARLIAETGYANAEVWNLDLSSFASIKAFATRFSQLPDTRLDILIENAGISVVKFVPSEDGWESSLRVNDLAASYHALLLLPFMIRTSEIHSVVPSLVFISSALHHLAPKFDRKILSRGNLLKALASEEYSTKSAMQDRYNITKLIITFFTRALASRLSSNKVLVDCANPGFCRSELLRDAACAARFAMTVMTPLFAHTTEEGSRQLVFGAVGGQGHETDLHGKYIVNSGVEEVSDYILSQEGQKIQERIWNETVDILSKADPEVKAFISSELSG